MRDLKKLEEVVRSLFRVEPPLDALAALSGDQAILRRLPEEYHEAASSLARRARKGADGKDPAQAYVWI